MALEVDGNSFPHQRTYSKATVPKKGVAVTNMALASVNSHISKENSSTNRINYLDLLTDLKRLKADAKAGLFTDQDLQTLQKIIDQWKHAEEMNNCVRKVIEEIETILGPTPNRDSSIVQVIQGVLKKVFKPE